jgi:hypothetical protein
MTPTAGSTSPPRLWPTCAASPGSAGRWPPAGCRSRRSAQFGRGPLTSPSLAGEPVGLAGQAVRFAAIGVASAIAYLLLFVLLRGAIGAQPANQPALLRLCSEVSGVRSSWLASAPCLTAPRPSRGRPASDDGTTSRSPQNLQGL